MYRAIREKLNSKPTFILSTEKPNLNKDVDYYGSLFYYNEDHIKKYTETGTLSGIKDTLTNKVYFDLDSKTDLNLAKSDTLELINRLEKMGITKDNYRIAFSGSKGFNVEFEIDKLINPIEFKDITFNLANGLKTFDVVVNDPNRVIRLINSKHQSSGLYKIPLLKSELETKSTDEIKELAKQPRETKSVKAVVSFENKLNNLVKPLEKQKEKPELLSLNNLDASNKPKYLDMARWYLQNGFFESGERHNAMLCLAATYKNQGFQKEHTYRLLKGVAEIQANRTNSEKFSNEEIWNSIISSVYSHHWKGGQYSLKDPGSWLYNYAKKNNIPTGDEKEDFLFNLDKLSSSFKDFAVNIDNNTIKLGIQELDDAVRVTTSMLVMLLAGPSAGKSTMCFNILNETSRQNIKSIFFSMDMGLPLVFQRLMQRQTGWTSDYLFASYKNSQHSVQQKEKELFDEYRNVSFSFKTGMTVDGIRDTIISYREANGQYPKLIIVDYLECVNGPFSDPTANSAFVAQSLKDIANDFNICVLLLVQPQKHVGDPSHEILSMRNIKGSSVLEQAASIIFTMWRPGFSPIEPENDRFLSLAVVKNRMGSLNKLDFKWDGLRGKIDSLEDSEREELESLVNRRRREREETDL